MNQASYPSSEVQSRRSVKRCINIDWLEVHAREPIERPHNADYFRQCGMIVHEREYGTRVYREMFVIDGTDGQPLLEVRRNPASQGLNGIHDMNETHIRLVNRTCYYDNAVTLFAEFLAQHDYSDVRISRVDLCLDFTEFDKGDNPQAFVRRYFRHKYAKINQGRISSHGEDGWNGQEWNSLAWGAKNSPVSTKLYNKTMELYDPKSDSYGKPWIRQAWMICGLVDDWQRCTVGGEKVDVWRVEFSVRSSVKNWVRIELDGVEEKYQSLRNSLDCYEDRGKMLVIFASLSMHYFRFKKYKQGKRKDRCKDKVLFDFSGQQTTYKVGRNDYAAGNNLNIRENYSRLIQKLEQYRQCHPDKDIFNACEVLIKAMQDDNFKADLAAPWSKEEIATMRLLLSLRTSNKDMTYEVAMSKVKEILGIKDRTIDIF